MIIMKPNINKEKIKRIFEKHREVVGVDNGFTLTYRVLGRGENNLNYLIIVNDDARFNLRVGLEDRLASNMQKEFETLKLVPRGIGPKPYVHDNSRGIIDADFTILEYIEGKSKARWSKRDLAMHARQLARLHQVERNKPGDINTEEESLNINARYQSMLQRFGTEGLDKKTLQALGNAEHWIKARSEELSKLRRFSLVHQDLFISNIFFNGNNVRYIDWEWASFNDPAFDIGRFYFTEKGINPWMIKLTPSQLDYFISEYSAVRKDRGIKERAQTWHEVFKIFGLLYVNWKDRNHTSANNALPRKFYRDTAKTFAAYIEKKYL